MKKVLLLIVIAVSILTGCGKMVDVDKLAIVTGVAVDKTDDKEAPIEVSIRLISTKAQKGTQAGPLQSSESIVSSSKAKTIGDAFNQFQTRSPKTLFYKHTKILLIGEGIARDGLDDALKYFDRTPDFRLTMKILVVEGRAKEALQTPFEIEESTTTGIVGLLETNKESSFTLSDTEMRQVTPKIEQKWGGYMMPKLNLMKREKKMDFSLEGGGLFNKDNKLIGWLHEDQARGIFWMRGEVKRTEISFPADIKGKYNSIVIKNVKAKMKLKEEKGKITGATIAVHVHGDVGEYNNKEELDKPSSINQLEEMLSRRVKEEMKNSLNLLQKKYKVDVVRIGREIYKKQPNIWKGMEDSWDEQFPNFPVELKVISHIRRVGLTSKKLD